MTYQTSLWDKGTRDVHVTMGSADSDRLRRLAVANDIWSLTPRQFAVLEHLVHGDASKSIAEKLGCRVNTVEVHVSAILKKAGVSSRAALVARFWTDLENKLSN